MSKYFSTFISGLAPVFQRWLRENVPDVKIEKLLDGLMIYKTSEATDSVKNFPVFNNSFVLLKEFWGNKLPAFDFILEKDSIKRYKTFRVVASKENQIIGIEKNLLSKYERHIARKSGLFLDRTNPDVEVWILLRSEGLGLVGLRITKNPSLEKTLHKGKLRPQLAYMLNYISEPNPNDIFLDPFAGYGAIPKARKQYFPAKEIIASDKDSALLVNLKQELKGIRVEDWDALDLKEIGSDSIDKIVTDPPWGIYLKDIDIGSFYGRMLKEFARVVKPEGIAVVLTSQKELMDKLLNNFPDFALTEKLDILVSGKKSSIYKIKKE